MEFNSSRFPWCFYFIWPINAEDQRKKFRVLFLPFFLPFVPLFSFLFYFMSPPISFFFVHPSVFAPVPSILSAAVSIWIKPVDPLFARIDYTQVRVLSSVGNRDADCQLEQTPRLVSASARWELNDGSLRNDVIGLLCGHSGHV